MSQIDLGFPVWLRLTHYCNALFLTLLIRSGIQILADHPKLYWNDHSHPGSEWFRFGKRRLPENALWTSMDEAVEVSPLAALPGGRHALGNGRHWHFLTVLLWMCNGLTYVALLFATDNWRRLIPTSFEILPNAIHDFFGYLTFHAPPLAEFHPYDPLQQLAYCAVVFLLTPLTIATGMAMSPAICAQFPWSTNIFNGQQKARSLHFLCMAAYLAFSIVHVTLVFVVYFKRNVLDITFGDQGADFIPALLVFFSGMASIVALNWAANVFTTKNKRMMQNIACSILEPIRKVVFRQSLNHQQYSEEEISPYFRVNGRPPETEEYLSLFQNDFKGYQLHIDGLVENPSQLTMDDLKAMTVESHTTKHICIQGWTAIGQWTGVPMKTIIEKVRPHPSVKRIYFESFQVDPEAINYYTSLSLEECIHPKTILAYEMNHASLPVEHGAPLRLRIENKLGFTMCKWIRAIHFCESIHDYGLGHGGYREDHQYYGSEAQI